MSVEQRSRLPAGWAALLAFLASLAFLYFGRPVLLPLALAVLISLALSPLVSLVGRRGIRRIPAVLLVTGVILVALGCIAWNMMGQLADLADRLPEYRRNIHGKMEALRGSTPGLLRRFLESVQDLGHEISRGKPSPEKPELPKVEVVAPTLLPLQFMGGVLSSGVTSLGSAAVVVLLIIFLLVYQTDLRDRLTHLAGVTRVQVTLRMVEEAASHTSRYLLLQTAINAVYGAAFTLGMFSLGVPNAILWGALGFLLRYVPYLGPFLASILPIALSAVVFEGWSRPLLVAGFLIVLELVIGNGVEPVIYGKGTGLSPIAVVLSAMFWTCLWGGPGLILAVPITSSLATLGRHVRPLRFLNVLLGNEPNLEPEFRLYHRLLAGDVDAALDLVDEFGKGRTLGLIYDELLVPALALAEQNRHLDGGEDSWSPVFLEGMRSILGELEDRSRHLAAKGGAGGSADPASVLIVPVADEADGLCARMLGGLLSHQGLPSRILDVSTTTGDKAEQVERSNPDILCLSAIPLAAVLQTRYLLKRIRSRSTSAEILVGLWNLKEDPEAVSARVSGEERVRVLVTLGEASREIQEMATAYKLRAKDSASAGPRRE
jgi:predicted PurR-regulated permease PerM